MAQPINGQMVSAMEAIEHPAMQLPVSPVETGQPLHLAGPNQVIWSGRAALALSVSAVAMVGLPFYVAYHNIRERMQAGQNHGR